jgi:hypothetical protein
MFAGLLHGSLRQSSVAVFGVALFHGFWRIQMIISHQRGLAFMKGMNALGWAALSVPFVLLLAGCESSHKPQPVRSVHTHSRSEGSHKSQSELKLTLDQDGSGGSWETVRLKTALRGGWLTLRLVDSNSNWIHGIHLDSEKFEMIEPVSASGPLHFTLQLDAGRLWFTGEMRDEVGRGRFRFEPDPNFKREFEPLFVRTPSEVEWMLLGIHDVSSEYLRGLGRLNETFSAAQVLALRRNGVSVEYITALRQSGIEFSVEEVTQLRRAGVSSEYAAALHRAGRPISAGEMIKLRHSGTSSEFFAGLKEVDRSLSTARIIRLRHSGVSLDFYREVKSAMPELEAEEIVRLRHAGLSADYLRQWVAFDFPVEELIRLRNSGVPADYAAAIQQAGYELRPDQIIRLRHSGITAGYLAGARKAGYNFSPEDLIRLRNAGVTTDYLAGLHVPGQENLTADMIIQVRQRGLSPELVKQIRTTNRADGQKTPVPGAVSP